jgi:CheY-like chemotaxis protein
VLCDVNLGGSSSGFQVARTLRSDVTTRRTSLVAITGHDSEACREQARAAGFDRVICKPLSLATLAAIVDAG